MNKVKDIFLDFHSKEFDFGKQFLDVRNNIVVKKEDYKKAGVLFAFMDNLFKPNQKLFAVVYYLKGEEETFSGKHFIREVRDVSYFDGYYIVTWHADKFGGMKSK